MSRGHRNGDSREPQSAGTRRRRHWLARLLHRSSWVRRILRRLVWADGSLEILEEGNNSAAAHQMFWARMLEHGSAMSVFMMTPKGAEPENFPQHLEQCRCVFWQWFLEQGIEKEIRTILDVGCGMGFTTEHFVRRGFDVTGVTRNPHEKYECVRRQIKILEEDFHFLSVPDASFDMVFSSHSLEHSISPLFALWEWKRVIRPGGYLMIVIPMPIEQDARAAFPEYYQPATDMMSFPPASDGTISLEEVLTAACAYGAALHPFVLTYWQLRWLFHLTGLEFVSDAVEDTSSETCIGVEHVDGSWPRDTQRALNGMFFLRKPAW